MDELASQVEVLLRLGFAALELDEAADEQCHTDPSRSSQLLLESVGLYSDALQRSQILQTQTAGAAAEQVPILPLVLCNALSTYAARIQQLQAKAALGLRGPGGSLRARSLSPGISGPLHSRRTTSDPDGHVDDPQCHEAQGQDIGSGGGGPSQRRAFHLAAQLERLQMAPGSLQGLSEAALDLIEGGLQRPEGHLDDVAGCAAVKAALRESFLLPLRFPQFFKGSRRPPSGFLFYGPPGTGKTLLANKICAEAKLPLLSLSPSGVLSRYLGESEKAIRAAFEVAKRLRPCVIFIDEIDSLGTRRGRAGEEPAGRRVLTELLLQISSLGSGSGHANESDRDDGPAGVYLIAATNRLEDLDEALVRRFDRTIQVPYPDAEARVAFFRIALSKPELMHSLLDQDVARLVDLTEGFSGSDLSRLVRETSMYPVRELMQVLMAADPSDRDTMAAIPSPKYSGATVIPRPEPGQCQPSDVDMCACTTQEGEHGARIDIAGGAGPQLGPITMEHFLGALRTVRPSAEAHVTRTEEVTVGGESEVHTVPWQDRGPVGF